MKHYLIYIICAFFSISLLSSCDLDIAPSDSLTGDQMANSSDGLIGIINGCYAVLKDYQEGQSDNTWYLRQYYQMSDFASDDVVYGYQTEDNLNMIFRYPERNPGLENITSFWINNYKIIYSANVALSVANLKEESALVDRIKGEALFLKAFAMHNLVRLYAKPYSAANASTPGIIIREDNLDTANKPRATVQETYDYIIKCLLDAETLMDGNEDDSRASKGFASIGAVRALLSRVYLYEQDYDNCIKYADEVIGSEEYQLTEASEYKDYFRTATSASETIWCVIMNSKDDKKSGSIASMIMKGDGCWGEEGYSMPLLKDMGIGTDLQDVDVRFDFVEPSYIKNGLTLYPCSKFSWQNDIITSISPVMLRLSEVYFNRAEAYANKTQDTKALDDINEVRKHRIDVTRTTGESVDDFLYKSSDLDDNSSLDLVLKEKRIEFAFEAHRFFDLMRNGKDIVRNYWGFHILTYSAGQSVATLPGLSVENVVTSNSYPRLVFPIPTQEVSNNLECEQNEGY